MKLRRPALRYHGGKWKLAPWIIGFFPRHRVYVEPFAGGASVLLRKERVPTEIYNDLDRQVVGLFRVLRDVEQAEKLAQLLTLTPFARDEYGDCYEHTDDPVEAARRLIARSFMGQSSKGVWQRSGFDTRVNDDGFVSRVNSLKAMPGVVRYTAERLCGVVIENEDGVRLVERYDRADCLIYADPPYLPSTRATKIYDHDMSAAGHVRMLEALRGLESAMVAISGYPSELYDHALAGWDRHERPHVADTGAERTEVLWLNPACSRALKHTPRPHGSLLEVVA